MQLSHLLWSILPDIKHAARGERMNISSKMFFCVVLVCVLGSAFSQSTCGRKLVGARIIGGEEAIPHSWPWQLSLKLKGNHHCGASLLTPTWAITAAHCVEDSDNPKDYKVAVGAHLRKNDGVLLPVSKIIPYPYEYSSAKHDLALIRLAKPAQLNQKVQPVCLPQHGDRAKPGKRCFISGWGRIDPNDLWKAADKLKQAEMPIVDFITCRDKNGYVVDGTTMVCVGGEGHYACNGDSGGPLMCEENGRWVLRGIASWTPNDFTCLKYYSMYARVSAHVNWINKNLKG